MINKRNAIDYILVLFTVYISGSRGFSYLLGGDEIANILIFIFVFSVVIYRGINFFDKKYLIFITIFLLIAIAQYNVFSHFALYTYLGVFVKVGIAMLVSVSVRDFLNKYINVIYYLSIISLVFFTLMNFSVFKSAIPYEQLIGKGAYANNILLYDFQMGFYEMVWNYPNSNRNPGPFWEPGAFGGYLIFALFFLLVDNLYNKKFTKKELRNRFAIFLLAIITTTSTTTFICLFIVLIFFSLKSYSKTVLQRFVWILYLLPILIIGSIYAYTGLEFMGEKIAIQYEVSSNKEGGWYSTRFGNFIFNMEYIESNPIWGSGPSLITRFHLHPWMAKLDFAGMGNGFTEILVKYGLVGFFTIYYLLYKGLRNNYNKDIVLFFLLIMTLQLQGEQFQNFALFYVFMFIPQKKIFIN